MILKYPACFFKEKKGYAVIFPDLNWLATSGKNKNVALQKAKECLSGYLKILDEDGDNIPKSSNMEDISIKEVAKELEADEYGAFINVVSLDDTCLVKRRGS